MPQGQPRLSPASATGWKEMQNLEVMGWAYEERMNLWPTSSLPTMTTFLLHREEAKKKGKLKLSLENQNKGEIFFIVSPPILYFWCINNKRIYIPFPEEKMWKLVSSVLNNCGANICWIWNSKIIRTLEILSDLNQLYFSFYLTQIIGLRIQFKNEIVYIKLLLKP